MTLTTRLERACLRHLPVTAVAPGALLAASWAFAAAGVALVLLGWQGGPSFLTIYVGLGILMVGALLRSHAMYVAAARLLHDTLADPDEVRDRRAEALRFAGRGPARGPAPAATRRPARAAASKTRAA